MAYIGRGLSTGQYTKLDSISDSFNGSTTSFNLTRSSTTVTPSAQNLLISIDGIIQEPLVAFSVTGSVINFSTAPGDGATFFGIMMGDAAFIAGDSVAAGELGVTAGTAKASKAAVLGTGKDISDLGNVSGSSISTGSFGKLLGDGSSISGITTFAGTAGTETAFSGSSSSTGSFGSTHVMGNLNIGTTSSNPSASVTLGTSDANLTISGSIFPALGSHHDLGAATHRWHTLYVADLELKNQRGDWTIIEEEEYLSIRNNKSNKMYKFVLEEIE